jgi:predicted transcriptional regulator
MPTRRLDDRIRELSAKVAEISRGGDTRSEDVEATLHELLAAIRQKIERLRSMAATKLVHKSPHPADRRVTR